MQNSKQNTKYEITDIVHWRYPFLHRIRALRDIGNKIKAGDLGGFVESEQNLSFEPGDEAWLFDDSICCNEARVDKNSILKDEAVVSGRAYITGGSSRIKDLGRFVYDQLGLKVNLCEEPESTVIMGLGAIIEDPSLAKLTL